MPYILIASVVAAVLLWATVMSSAGADTGAVRGSPARPLPGDVLPDLRVEPSETVKLTAARGSRKLRFATDVTNLGPGPLELIRRNRGCRRDSGSSSGRRAYQSIRVKDGARRHVRAGCIAYHRLHSHWHFERFVSAQLRRTSDGRLVAQREKVSFCLEDSHRSMRVPGDLADEERYSGCGHNARMGISAGWTDHYDADVSGQSIEIRGIPPGRYRLALRVDPENRLIERNERNNRAAVTLRLAAEAVSEVPQSGSGQ